MNSNESASARSRVARRWLILVVVCLGMFAVEMDTTVVNIALPSIQRDLSFSAASLALVLNVYLLFFGGFLLLGGRLGDLLGRRRLFIWGLIAFAAGSIANALTPSATLLVIGRCLQGLGGAAMTPTSLTVINTTFTDPVERNRALGVWTAIEVGGVAVGLVVGGLITTVLSWRWIFVMNIVVAVIALVGALRVVPESRSDEHGKGFDIGGAVSITGSLMLLIYALTNAGTWGWGSVRTIALFAGGAALLAIFVAIEARSESPLVRLEIFRIRSLTLGNVSFLLTSCGIFGMFYFSSLFVQGVLGFTPLRSGLALLPLTVGVLIGAGAGQPLMKRFDLRLVAVAGLILSVTGMVVLTGTSFGGGYLAFFLPGICILAVGLGLAMVPFTLLSTSGVPARDAGLASGLYTAVSSSGGALGLAVLTAVAARRSSAFVAGLGSAGSAASLHARLAALVAGYHAAYIAGAVLMTAAALLIVALLRREDVVRLAAGSEPTTTAG